MKIRKSLFILLAAILFSNGCVSVRDVTQQQPFNEQIGKQYVLLRDCYIFKYQGENGELFVDDDLPNSFPPVISDYIGKNIGGQIIVGILKKGTKFEIVHCVEKRSPEDIFDSYKCQIIESSIQLPELDVSLLTDMLKHPPAFRSDKARLVNDH
jgi:hypothetical protein